MRAAWFVMIGILVAPLPAAAQDTRYSSWRDPNAATAQNGDLDAFVKKLNALIDEAEKARAADPVFLRDLRALAAGVNNGLPKTVLDDSFSDGDYTRNPAWEVLSGAYFIEAGWGLRNKILQSQPQTATSKSSSGEEFAKVLLGTILKQAAGVKDTQGATENTIATRVAISNAFAVTFEMSSWLADSHFEAGVFQGKDAKAGYRVVYESGKALQLHRIGASGSNVVQTSATTLTLEDKKYHTVEWTRGADGTMTVRVDGTEYLRVVDRGFSDPFDGLRFSDKGDDFIVKRVTVKGS